VQRAIIGLVLGGGVGAAAYWRRLLTLDGGVAAAVVGATVFARGGLAGTAGLMTFFVTSSALSRLPRQRGSAQQDKGSRRDALQVLANGGPATVCIAISRPMGFLAALMAAGADTWATEVGMRVGGQPRLVTTLEKVDTGRSGGITLAGTAASLGGAAVVAAAWNLAGGRPRAGWQAISAGVAGGVVDSVLGATLQVVYECPVCGRLTEQRYHPACGSPTHWQRGWRWMNNDAVNALSTAAAGLIGLAL
jgi:uncharacterized protein (TIGR00297 family)